MVCHVLAARGQSATRFQARVAVLERRNSAWGRWRWVRRKSQRRNGLQIREWSWSIGGEVCESSTRSVRARLVLTPPKTAASRSSSQNAPPRGTSSISLNGRLCHSFFSWRGGVDLPLARGMSVCEHDGLYLHHHHTQHTPPYIGWVCVLRVSSCDEIESVLAWKGKTALTRAKLLGLSWSGEWLWTVILPSRRRSQQPNRGRAVNAMV